MKTSLRISIALNLALSAIVLYLSFVPAHSFTPQTQSDFTPPPVITNSQVSAAAQPSNNPASTPFRWSQLESPDYRVYVANLRNIGCPEQTVRDIVTADIEALYSAKRRQIHLDGNQDLWSREEQARLTAYLLSGQTQPDRSPTDTHPSSSEISTPAAMPLVFQNVDLTAMNLDAGQLKAIEELREQFVKRVGGISQDPSDPAYLRRWQEAQPESDELLQGMIGRNNFQNYQLRAAGANPALEIGDAP